MTADEKSHFQEWYEDNADKLNEQRKERYHSDPEYREKRKLEARRYYWLKKRRAKSVESKKLDLEEIELKPDETLDIVVTNPRDIREGMKLTIPVYHPSTLSDYIGRSVQTIRLWFLNEYLPEVTYRNAREYRVYTEDQMKAFIRNRHLLELPSKNFENNPYFMKLRQEFDELEPDGIAPMDKDYWRQDPTSCPYCGSTPSLQRKDEEEGWIHVPCFNCIDPAEVDARSALKRYRITGTCRTCGEPVDKELETIGENIIVTCDKCGARVPNDRFEIEEY